MPIYTFSRYCHCGEKYFSIHALYTSLWNHRRRQTRLPPGGHHHSDGSRDAAASGGGGGALSALAGATTSTPVAQPTAGAPTVAPVTGPTVAPVTGPTALARTGVETGTALVGGGLVLALGLVLMVLTRRRPGRHALG